jgi:hypothetical protein
MDKNEKIKAVVIVAIIMALAIIIAYFAISLTPSTNASPSASFKTLDDNGEAKDGSAPEKSKEDMLAELEAQQIVVTDNISTNISFPSGKTGEIGTWKVENIAENNVIMQVEVFIGTQLVAKTTPIYPDQYIDEITLDADIPTGDTPAVAYINYYDIETKNLVGKTAYDITISAG